MRRKACRVISDPKLRWHTRLNIRKGQYFGQVADFDSIRQSSVAVKGIIYGLFLGKRHKFCGCVTRGCYWRRARALERASLTLTTRKQHANWITIVVRWQTRSIFSRFHFVQGRYRCLRTASCLVTQGSRSLTFVVCSLRVSMLLGQFCYSPGVNFGGRWKWTWRVTWRIWSSVDFWRWSCRENRESLHTRQVTLIKDFVLSLIASDKLFLS